MTKTYTAPFAQTQRTGTAAVSAAVGNLASDAPTGLSLIATAGAEGALLTRLFAVPRGTVTATGLVLFLASSDGAIRLIDSELMTAYTASTTTGIPETAFTNYNEGAPLRLAAGDKLYVGCLVAQGPGVVFRAEYSDF